MPALWHFADVDLLASKNPYQLRNTGQGLHRVQAAPAMTQEMQNVVSRVHRGMGGWVGSRCASDLDYEMRKDCTYCPFASAAHFT
jgi:hypothetical protein